MFANNDQKSWFTFVFVSFRFFCVFKLLLIAINSKRASQICDINNHTTTTTTTTIAVKVLATTAEIVKKNVSFTLKKKTIIKYPVFFLNIVYSSHFHTKPGEMSIKFKLKEKKKADDSSSAQNHRI